MTPQEINQTLAVFHGYTNISESDCGNFICGDNPNGSGRNRLPDYYNTNAAFDLLDVLVERGWQYSLEYISFCKPHQRMMIFTASRESWVVSLEASTKSAAICLAIIQLLEKEKI